MIHYTVAPGTADVTLNLFIPDASSSVGAGLTGLVYNSSGLACYYVRPLAAAAALSLATQTVTGAHSDGGFVEVSSANMPGVYRLDLSDAVCAVNAASVLIMLKGAANMVPVLIQINLDALVSTRASQTSLAVIDDFLDTEVAAILEDTGTTLPAQIAALNNLSTAQVNAEVDTALADARLDELLAADSDIDGAAPPVVGSVFHELLTKTAASFTYDQATDSLEAIRDKETDIETDTAEIGAAGAGLTALATQASVNIIDDFLDTEIAAILADTNELQVDWVNGGRLDLLVDAIKAKTDALPADPADDSDIDAQLAIIAGYLDTEVAAIKAKTDNLPAAPAATGDIPTAAANADALLDRSNAIEAGLTPRQALQLAVAALAAKLSGAATTTVTIRNAVADTKNRITATVDANGNRSAITYDLT